MSVHDQVAAAATSSSMPVSSLDATVKHPGRLPDYISLLSLETGRSHRWNARQMPSSILLSALRRLRQQPIMDIRAKLKAWPLTISSFFIRQQCLRGLVCFGYL